MKVPANRDKPGLEERLLHLEKEFRKIKDMYFAVKNAESEWDVKFILKTDIVFANKLNETAIVCIEVMELLTSREQLDLEMKETHDGTITLVHKNRVYAEFPRSFMANIDKIFEVWSKFKQDRLVYGTSAQVSPSSNSPNGTKNGTHFGGLDHVGYQKSSK